VIKIVKTLEPIVARSASLFWWKRIYVGLGFDDLHPSTQAAVLAHEEGHCNMHHMEQRIVALLWWPAFKWLCYRQEFSADRYAAKFGHTAALFMFLKLNSVGEGPYHPSSAIRRLRLLHNNHYARHPSSANPAPLA
jgi:Zn-dependent protease with chaperone function